MLENSAIENPTRQAYYLPNFVQKHKTSENIPLNRNSKGEFEHKELSADLQFSIPTQSFKWTVVSKCGAFFCFFRSNEDALKLIEAEPPKSKEKKRSNWQERDMGGILCTVVEMIF